MALAQRLAIRAARGWWWLRRPRTLGVRAIVLDEAGRVALVRHSYVSGWYLPGGGVRRNENVGEALARELREEVALERFTIERLMGVYHSRRDYKDDHVVVFAVRALNSAELKAADAIEIEAFGWFEVSDLPADTSPATLRRIAEHGDGATGTGAW